MASVKFELRNEGKGLHEWDYLPLSDIQAVRLLIINRSKQDKSYEMKLYCGNSLASPGVVPMSEPISVTYLDLERLIDTGGLTDDETIVVERLMMGYTRTDIAEAMKWGTEKVSDLFTSAVEKIVERNEYEWYRCMANRKKLGFV